ncbi:MAG: tRNA 2-thiouridine(34) synthase MnmA [Proteobacteria bacterium]|nr:tRNA 2-thiouridine(34) synthase MnmA [Pseudomonadota bacterium]MBU4382576.1 tRNA 2-thiouridine(34) synthase MnmA [Pseudomonadota bacterium]MCG2765092.1 tRNA 2-thiouridine(34) synthase MnmA [Desulfarculaceae bacterium]
MGKLAVAMSGGVDSSLAALVLKQAGHQIVGLSLRLGAGPDQAWRAGAAAAAQLGLEHRVVEAAGPFEERVLRPVAKAYAGGLTPNPCALCNAKVKLPLLWEAAREMGCEALATGHYARLERSEDGPCLAEAEDRSKSQAYFLAQVAPELLKRLSFPLGEMEKGRVRELAAQEGLVAAQRPESQDCCFLPPGGWDEFMEQRGAIRPGVLEDAQGRELGRHQGLHRFTVGQRRGLGLAMGQPVYVTGLDGGRAAVRVGARPELTTLGLEAVRPLWYRPPRDDEEVTVRFRYSHPGVKCRVEPNGRGLRALFAQEQGAVAPGQLAVFYRARTIVGSAWIDKAIQPLRIGTS